MTTQEKLCKIFLYSKHKLISIATRGVNSSISKKTECAIIAILCVLTMLVFFNKFPLSLFRIYDSVPSSFIHRGEGAYSNVIPSDVLQMVYLVWAAGDSLSKGTLLLADHHQYANLIETFYPLITDPLVYLTGALSLILPLALAYNFGMIVLPNLVFSIASYFLLMTLNIKRPIAFGYALLSVFIPFRIHLLFYSQHFAYSAIFVPIYFYGIAQFFLHRAARLRGALIAGAALILLGLSEEHLAYYAVLFSWPFCIAYVAEYLMEMENFRKKWKSAVIRVAKETWPIILALFFLVLWGRSIQLLLVGQSLVPRVHGYPLIVKHFSQQTFTWLYLNLDGGFSFTPISMILLFGSALLFAERVLRRKAASVDFFVLALWGVFLSSSILSLGHMAKFVKMFGWEPYRILYDHLPLFNMQRFPMRMSFFATFSGLILGAYCMGGIVDMQPIRKPAIKKVIMGCVMLFLIYESTRWVGQLREGQYFDVSKDPYPKLHETIRKTAGKTHIILRMPAYNSATFEDTRTLLNIMYTGSRFFNGYHSFVPKIYMKNYKKFKKLMKTGTISKRIKRAFAKIGIEYILIDREFIDIDSSAIRKLLSNPAVKTILKTREFLYLRLESSPDTVSLNG